MPNPVEPELMASLEIRFSWAPRPPVGEVAAWANAWPTAARDRLLASETTDRALTGKPEKRRL